MENKTGLDDELYKLLIEKKKNWIVNMLEKINGIQNLVSFYDNIDDKEYVKPFGKEMVGWHKQYCKIEFKCINCKNLSKKSCKYIDENPYCNDCTETNRIKKKKETYNTKLEKENDNINKILKKVYIDDIISINNIPISEFEKNGYDNIWTNSKLLLKCFNCNVNERLIRVDLMLTCPYYGCLKCGKLKDRYEQSILIQDEKKIIKNEKVDLEFKCNQINCKKSYNSLQALNHHKAIIHKIYSNKKIYKCEYCNDDKLWKKYDLKQHILYKHSKSKIEYICEFCEYSTKINSNLNRHKQYTHDIGDNECEFCAKNKNSNIEFEDHFGIHKICRDCYKKITGHNSRIEHDWSDYIDKNFDKGFLLGSDKSLKSLGGCLNKRPDKIYITKYFILILECDEHQHKWNNGSYECEEKRISDIYNDEESIFAKKLIVIRWNPDNYLVPIGYHKHSKKERLELIVKFMNYIVNHKIDDLMHVYYMYYDSVNEKIVKNIPYTLIYDEKDFPKI